VNAPKLANDQPQGGTTTTHAPLIRVQGAAKKFVHSKGTVHALHECYLDVAPGEFVSLLGPSGCGKSTLLRLVGGLLDCDVGKLTVDGMSPLQAREDKRYGFVPQTPALLPWRTVRGNVELLRGLNRRHEGGHARVDIDELLEIVGLGPFVSSYPRELSGGMQQRVALVRAFALGAPILLMDEPFAALDEITREAMRYLLLDLWQRSATTVIFVTHSISEAVILSDRVVILSTRPGRVTAIEEISLPRPREPSMEDSDVFVGHTRNVRAALRSGWGQ
jgi:NitT/TauT family transport system ATP-binding protein